MHNEIEPHRRSELEISGEQFRDIGHELIDRIADFLDGLPERPVTPGETPAEVRSALGTGDLPEKGASADQLMQRVP